MPSESAPSHDSVLPPLPTSENGASSSFMQQPSLKPKNIKWIIIVIVCYMILLYGGAAYFFLYKKSDTNTAQPNTTERALPTIQNEEATVATASSSFQTIAPKTTLPLIRLIGTDEQTQATASGTINIPFVFPTILHEQCAAYQFASFIVIGPKNWRAYVTETDGEINIRLSNTHPYTYGNTAVWYGRTTTGSNDSIQTAAPFFEWIQTNETIKNLVLSLPEIKTDYNIQEVTPRLLRYSFVYDDPAFDDLGIVYTDAADHLKDTQWTTYYMTTVTKKNTLSQEFVMELLNTFIQQYQLR
ncbi:MAG: hypothetical protein WAV51_02085 [Microgenomates group bacterium]